MRINLKLSSPSDFYIQAFSRNIGLITETEQERLRHARVAIVGMGGVGGIHLATLTRMGFGRFNIADFDVFDVPNLNRQYGAFTHTLGRKKTEVMKEIATSINPEVEINVFDQGINEQNIDAFLKDVDVAIDGVDFFAIDARRLFFNEARKRGIYAITGGPIGYGSVLHVFSPEGMSFDDYFGIHDGMSSLEKIVAFGVGLIPKPLFRHYSDSKKIDLKNHKGPSLGSACSLASGLVATEAVNVITRRRPIKASPHYFQFDPLLHVYIRGYMWGGARNPFQVIKRWVVFRRLARDNASS